MFGFNKKNKIKVMGELVRYEVENGQHYPVFKFTTLDGRLFEIRNIPKDTNIKETSVEDVYIDEGVNEFLSQPLPLQEIPIKYVEEDPTDFLPRWL